MENHYFQWVNPLFLCAIFNSYVITRGYGRYLQFRSIRHLGHWQKVSSKCFWDHLRASPLLFFSSTKPRLNSSRWVVCGEACGKLWPTARVPCFCTMQGSSCWHWQKIPLGNWTWHSNDVSFHKIAWGYDHGYPLFSPSPMFKTKSRVRITILVGNSGSFWVNLPSGYLAVCYGKWSIYGWITMNYLYLPTKITKVSFVLQNPKTLRQRSESVSKF